VLCLVDVLGVPMLLWKLLEEVVAGDRVVLYRGAPAEVEPLSESDRLAAVLFGALVSEGHASTERAGFNNLDRDFFDEVVEAYDLLVGGRRYTSHREIASGSLLHELDVQDTRALQAGLFGELVGLRSADKRVPDVVWARGAGFKKAFLQALFEGDGSASRLPRRSVQVSYSTRSERLARDVQSLLLEFGVVSSATAARPGCSPTGSASGVASR
jgi:DNA gyrase subunit A